jgi:hypothetical protein
VAGPPQDEPHQRRNGFDDDGPVPAGEPGLAARHRISPLVAAVPGITGIISGLLSPLAAYGLVSIVVAPFLAWLAFGGW